MLIIDHTDSTNKGITDKKIGGDPSFIRGTPEWREAHPEELRFAISSCIPDCCKANSISMENVDHPDHYNDGKVECIDAIESALGKNGFESWLVGTAIKYLWRYKHKNGVEDLRKAKWYIDYLVEYLKPNQTNPTASKYEMMKKIAEISKANIELLNQLTANDDDYEQILMSKYQKEDEEIGEMIDQVDDVQDLLRDLVSVEKKKGKEKKKGNESIKPK